MFVVKIINLKLHFLNQKDSSVKKVLQLFLGGFEQKTGSKEIENYQTNDQISKFHKHLIFICKKKTRTNAQIGFIGLE